MNFDRGIKIIFVVNWLKRRGAEQQLFDFIEELPPHVSVSIFRFSNTDDEFPELFRLAKVKIYSSRYLGTYNLLRLKSLYDCLSKEKYDVVVTLGLGAALFFGRVCAFLSGIKIVYSILNTFENFQKLPNLPGEYFDIFNKFTNKLISSLHGNRIFKFLPNSNKLAERISLSSRGSYPVQILHNGIPIEEFKKISEYKPNRKTTLVESQLKGSPTIIQIGALDINKNQIFSLECIRGIREQIPDIRFSIVGEGPKKFKLIKWTLANDLSDQVIFTGEMDRMECLYLMSKSDLLVLTSESESFPNVLVEAQALSLPVVAFDVGAVSEIIEHGVTGYVIGKGNCEGFKKAILKILSDKILATRMGKIGKKRAFNIFSMDKKVEHFLLMIENDFRAIRDTAV